MKAAAGIESELAAADADAPIAAAAPAPSLEHLVDFAGPAAASTAPTMTYGTVERADVLEVRVEGRTARARRAKSCLVAPDAGDRVLCVLDGVDVYVLAVLDGAPDAKLVADGKLEVHAEELSLSGSRVTLRGAAVTIAADALKMRAKSAVAVIDDLKLLGGAIEANIADQAVLLAERVETRATRILQRAKQVFRFVDDLEQARVRNYDLRAEGLAVVRAENTIVSARVLAKLDGEQVKIG